MKLKNKLFRIFLYIMMVIFLILGCWQIKRLSWKNDIVGQIRKNLTLSNIEIKNSDFDYQNNLYKKVKIRGKLHNDKEIHLYAGGKMAHGSDGYLIFTPLEMNDGKKILINRGWVPQTKKDSLKRAETFTIGVVEIEGIILPIKEAKWHFFKNNLKNNVWLWLDLKEIQDYTEFDLDNYYILQQGNWKNIPINTKFSEEIIRNDHLQYALTWFSLFFIIGYLSIIIWVKDKKDNHD